MLMHDPKRLKYKRPLSLDYGEQGSQVYVSHTVYIAHGNSKGETRRRNRLHNTIVITYTIRNYYVLKLNFFIPQCLQSNTIL